MNKYAYTLLPINPFSFPLQDLIDLGKQGYKVVEKVRIWSGMVLQECFVLMRELSPEEYE